MENETGVIEQNENRNSNTFGMVLTDRTQTAGTYTGEQTITAYYGMIDWFAIKEIRIVGGVRAESTLMETTSADERKRQGKIDVVDILPSINLTYALNDKMNLRAAYGKTLARPTFREIAPYDNYMPIEHRKYVGNDSLTRALVDNIDLRWEWFSNPGEIVSVGGFVKLFQDPIERAVINNNGYIKPVNVGEAFLYGAEFEFRKNLGFLHLLRDFNFGFNLTLVQSQVDLPEHEYSTRKQYDPDVEKTRELQGQSPYVVNFDLTYANRETDTEANLHFYVFGKRLSEIGYGTPDYYQFPGPELNLVVSQKFFEHFKLKLSAKNLLDSKYYVASTFKGADYVKDQYRLGRSLGLSFSYTLD